MKNDNEIASNNLPIEYNGKFILSFCCILKIIRILLAKTLDINAATRYTFIHESNLYIELS